MLKTLLLCLTLLWTIFVPLFPEVATLLWMDTHAGHPFVPLGMSAGVVLLPLAWFHYGRRQQEVWVPITLLIVLFAMWGSHWIPLVGSLRQPIHHTWIPEMQRHLKSAGDLDNAVFCAPRDSGSGRFSIHCTSKGVMTPAEARLVGLRALETVTDYARNSEPLKCYLQIDSIDKISPKIEIRLYGTPPGGYDEIYVRELTISNDVLSYSMHPLPSGSRLDCVESYSEAIERAATSSHLVRR